MMLAQFVNWRKDIYSGHTEKPKESPSVRNCSNQEKDVATKREHDHGYPPSRRAALPFGRYQVVLLVTEAHKCEQFAHI